MSSKSSASSDALNPAPDYLEFSNCFNPPAIVAELYSPLLCSISPKVFETLLYPETILALFFDGSGLLLNLLTLCLLVVLYFLKLPIYLVDP
jgi:hypothetical protein